MEKEAAEKLVDEAAFIGGLAATARVAGVALDGIVNVLDSWQDVRSMDEAMYTAACAACDAVVNLERAIGDRRRAFRAAAGMQS